VRISASEAGTNLNGVICADFPTTAFLNHLYDLAQYRTESLTGKNFKTQFSVPKVEVANAVKRFQLLLQSHAIKLLQTHALYIRRSPRRRGVSEDSVLSMCVVIYSTRTPQPEGLTFRAGLLPE